MSEKVKGALIIIGGAEDKKGDCKILREVIEFAGGREAVFTIITTATERPEEAEAVYAGVFRKIGVGNIKVLNINSRDEANLTEYANETGKSNCIFFSGGDQLRITSILGGTATYDALHRAYRNGAVIVGTSAGASAMTETMIVEGKDNDPARKCTLKMAPGLGLLKEAVVDQHFDQRGRLGRLLCGVAQNPRMLGIGIDEDTAIRVFNDGHFDVIGSNAVTIIDGKSIKSSNVSELKPDEVLAISNVVVHVLPQKYGFDMKTREVLRYE